MCISRNGTVDKAIAVVKNNNIVEINGKHYDADTGASVQKPAQKAKLKASADEHGERVAFSKPVRQEASVSRKPAVHVRSAVSFSRRMAEELRHHPTEHARTLMRSAVEKPKPPNRQLVHAHSGVQVSHAPLITPKQSASLIDDKRLKHANSVKKSTLISHYNFDAPAHEITRPQPSETPIISHQKATLAATPRPRSTAELLDAAVERATSHEQPPFEPRGQKSDRRTSRRLYGGAAILVVILGGTLLHFTIPSITLELASSKAGFSAGVPSTNPSGYSLGGITAATGQVAVRYTNSGTGSSYTVNEQPTTWDDGSLKNLFLRDCGPYQTIRSSGTSYYVYGMRNMTWVSGGIWYQLKSDGSLSDEQLIGIASSL